MSENQPSPDLETKVHTYYTALDARDTHARECLVCVLASAQHEARGVRCTEFVALDRELDRAWEAWVWDEPALSI